MPIGDIIATGLGNILTVAQKIYKADKKSFKKIYHTYLITGIFTLVLYGLELMEHLGVFSLDEATMPGWLYSLSVLLLISLAYILLQLIVGLPVIIWMIVHYRKHLKIVIPASLFCFALALAAIATFAYLEYKILDALIIIFFFLYGSTATIAGYMGIKETHHKDGGYDIG